MNTPDKRVEEIANKYAYNRPQSGEQATVKRDEMITDINDILTQYHQDLMSDVVEPVAKAIYDQMPYYEDGAKPEWVVGGNSLKQDEAKLTALTFEKLWKD